MDIHVFQRLQLPTRCRTFRGTCLSILALGCTVFPIHKNAFAEDQTTLDTAREQAVSEVVAGLEEYAAVHNSYRVIGHGHAGRGQGRFHREDLQYPASIYSGISQYLSNVPKDPLHTHISQKSRKDFLVYLCKDRIGVFAETDHLQPSTHDQLWWSENDCKSRPILNAELNYFQIGRPIAELTAHRNFDAERQTAVAEAIAGFEGYASDNHTYQVAGHGPRGNGQGRFYRNRNGYPTIYSGISDYLTNPPKDPFHIDITRNSEFDLFVRLCNDRVGVFAKTDELIPSEEDQHWWSENNCGNRPVTKLGYRYYKLSKPLQSNNALPLITIDDFSYEGAFVLPSDTYGESSLNYAQGVIEVNGNSLFIAGHDHHDAIAEFLIPELVNSENLSDLNYSGAPRQGFVTVIDEAATGNPEYLDQIVGLERVGDSLVVNVMEAYDAPGDNTMT